MSGTNPAGRGGVTSGISPHGNAFNVVFDAFERHEDHLQPKSELQAIAKVMGSKLLDQLKLFSFVERVGKPVVASDILKKGYSIELPKISGRLDQERADVTARTVAVFDALYPVYKQKSEELHEKWRTVIEKKAELARASRSGPARPEG